MTARMTLPKPWGRRISFRLSVRALLVLVMFIGGGLGWRFHQARVQGEATAAIARNGGRVGYNWRAFWGQPDDDGFDMGGYISYSKPPSGLLRSVVQTLGDDLVGTVIEVQMSEWSPDHIDEVVVALGRLPRLESLTLSFDRNSTHYIRSQIRCPSRLKHLSLRFDGGSDLDRGRARPA